MRRPVVQAQRLPAVVPSTEPDSETYWREAGEGRLVITRCPECEAFVWIPRPFCPVHMDVAMEWVEVSGRGVVYSYTRVERGDGAFADCTPYTLAYVELAEGPRVMTNIVDMPGGEVQVGQEVEVVFHAAEDGLAVPRFAPIRSSATPLPANTRCMQRITSERQIACKIVCRLEMANCVSIGDGMSLTGAAAVDPLVDALYQLIRTGELSPGQRVDQRAVSERLSVSRTPLREALRALAADGVLVRTLNQGYGVAKLSAADLLQYYSIRTFLETEVLRTIEWPDDQQLAELRQANEECEKAADDGSIDHLVDANRRFHFLMFSWSPLTIIISEIERVWRVSDPYRTLHLSNPERRKRVGADHRKMIEAIQDQDGPRLIKLMDSHRSASRKILQDMLGSSLSTALMSLPQSATHITTRRGA